VHGDPGQSGLHDHHADAVRHDVVQFPGNPVSFSDPGHRQAGFFPRTQLLGRRRQAANQRPLPPDEKSRQRRSQQ
jgi:hypothetical protein